MARFLRLGTATNLPLGPIVAASDGYSYLATTITLAASAVRFNKGNTVSTWGPMASAAVSCPIPGWLSLPIPATDTNVVGPMNFNLGNVTGNLPVWADCIVLAANVYDSLLGADFLDVNVTQINGGAPTDVVFGVNVLTITGGAVSAAVIGSVGNLTTGVAVTSIAAGVGVNVSSINAAVGVNVSSMGVGVNVTAINGAAPTNTVFGVNVLTITGGAVSAAVIGSVGNLTTGVNVSSIAAGIGVNVSSIAAGLGVNVSSMGVGVNVTAINAAAVSTAMPPLLLDYVMNVYGAQSITLKDYYRVIGAAAAGKIAGASTPTGVHIFDPSGTVRVSAVMDAFGNRTQVSWVTG